MSESDVYQVAKAIITVGDGADAHYLMSIKRDPGSKSDGKLEFLGGRFEGNEMPIEALVRELSEEESSGHLAKLASERATLFFTITTDGAEHFLFPFQVRTDEFELLCHDPRESFGFELLAPGHLKGDADKFTRKTVRILGALNEGQ